MVTMCHEMYNFQTKLQKYQDQENTEYFRDGAFRMEPGYIYFCSIINNDVTTIWVFRSILPLCDLCSERAQ